MQVPVPSSPPSLLSPPQSGPSPPLVGQRASGGPAASGGGTGSLGARQLSLSAPSDPADRTVCGYLPLSSSGAPPPALGFPPASLAVSCCLRGILPLRGSPLSIRGCEAQAWTAPSSLGTTFRPLALVHVLAACNGPPTCPLSSSSFQCPRGDPSRRLS